MVFAGTYIRTREKLPARARGASFMRDVVQPLARSPHGATILSGAATVRARSDGVQAGRYDRLCIELVRAHPWMCARGATF